MKSIRNARRRGWFPLFLAVLSVAGCAPTHPTTYGARFGHGHGSQWADANQRRNESMLREYRLGAGDLVEVKFFHNPQFNETVRLRPDGRITLQRLGDLFADGMTPTQLDERITTAYSDIVNAPDVTVFVREYMSQRVYVLGEVARPGGYDLQRDMSIIQAVAEAGGATRAANFGSVMLVRRSFEGSAQAYKFNLKKVDGRSALDHTKVVLQASDVIYVPKRFIASVEEFMEFFYTVVLPPTDIYLRTRFLKRLDQ